MLDDLYQELIIDHARRPHNFGEPERADAHAEGFNPICGDRVRLFLSCDDGRVREAMFTGVGCAISTASASMLTDALLGRTREDAAELLRAFHAVMTGDEDPALPGVIGAELEALTAVKRHPARVKCATLACHAARDALSRIPASDDEANT